MSSSQKLLDEIARAWIGEAMRHRDIMLDVGRRLREYLIAGLEERHRMRSAEAKRSGILRSTLVNAAAERLGIKRALVYLAVGNAAVVELLSIDGRVGEMGYKTIRYFIPLIERRGGAWKHRGKGYVEPKLAETWSVKECYPQAREIFQRAVAENQSQIEVREIIYGLTERKPSHNRARIDPRGKEVVNTAAKVFERCSARDACEEMKRMIVNSSEPLLLADQLTTYLKSQAFANAVKLRELEERNKNRRAKAHAN